MGVWQMSADAAAAVPQPASSPLEALTSAGDSVADLEAELGLEPETGGDAAPAPAAAKPAAAKQAPTGDKAKDEPATEAKGDEKTETTEEPTDEEVLRGIMARSRQRRHAKRSAPAQAAKPDPPIAAKPAEPAKAAPAGDPAPKPSSETSAAVRDVLLQIEKLAADDTAAQQDPPASAAEAASAATDRRKQLEAIQARLDEISAGAKQTESLKTEIATLKDSLEGIQNHHKAQTFIAQQLDAIEADVPTLLNADAIREMKRGEQSVTGAPGTRYRNPVDLIHDAAAKFQLKYGQSPDIQALARRIEKKLQGSVSPEKTNGTGANGATEKKPQSRKTVSSALGSPPAARTGPDERSSKQVEEDYFSSLGIDPHD